MSKENTAKKFNAEKDENLTMYCFDCKMEDSYNLMKQFHLTHKHQVFKRVQAN